MNKMLTTIGAVALILLAGCQTRITAEKNPELAHPIQTVVNVDGTNKIITTGYMVTSGGWYATARSPLWATEELRGLNIGVSTNGMVTLGLDSYNRDLSTNAVTLTHNLATDFAILAEKAAAAYATCGASLATAEGQTAVKKAIASYILKGGKSDSASVTCSDGNCTFSDGKITETFSY